MSVNICVTNSHVLHIWRSPGPKSWGIAVGVISLGLGTAYYGSDALLLKIAYILGCIVLGLAFLDEWEDFIIDRAQNVVILRRVTIFQKLLRLQESVSMRLSVPSIIKVAIDKNQIILVLRSGLSLPISEYPMPFDDTEVHRIADKIETFLQLSRVECVDVKEYGIFSQTDHDRDSSDSDNGIMGAGNGQPRESVHILC